MKRKFSPVNSNDSRLEYTFENDVITVKYVSPEEEIVDVFDFSGFEDGEAVVSEFETDLPFNPFNSVKRVDGELEVEVINLIGEFATEEERFPEWEVI